ncbi:MAG: GIY-YIG nuclease family protein [Afipia sp.]|nr:GIY-YIG nuclease family protein [Afipia sp.]
MTSTFRSSEITLLARHGLSEDDVYDGRLETKIGREMSAKEAGKDLILTSARCRTDSSHRIRTRAGHCFQCKPMRIAFQVRHSSPGYVYIAGSKSGRVVKLGTASDLAQRERQLRAERYGGHSDWEIVFSTRSDQAGKLESEASARLSNKRVFSNYIKDGNIQTASEILRCRFSEAKQAIFSASGKRPIVWQSSRAIKYDFEEG